MVFHHDLKWKGGHRLTGVTSGRGARRRAASRPPRVDRTDDLVESAKALREPWLQRGLSCDPADVSAAEAAIGDIYALAGLRRPEVIWTPSPGAALDIMRTLHEGPESMTSGVTELFSASHRTMKARIRRRADTDPFPSQFYPPGNTPTWRYASYEPYIPDPDVYTLLRQSIWESLRTTLVDSVVTGIKRLVEPQTGVVTWLGQQEAYRVAYFSIIRELGLADLTPACDAVLDLQSAMVSSCGWWWPADDVCFVSDRPCALSTEPTPAAVNSERRLHNVDSPAIEFRDGGRVFAIHGTLVPEWVVTDPTVDRIVNEPNVEVRRIAIEHIGWEQFIEQSGIRLIDSSDDPGNPGARLDLYETPPRWSMPTRILLAVNGSVERDGTHRRYGLSVPGWASTALDAAGWTYGLPGNVYARLQRRT